MYINLKFQPLGFAKLKHFNFCDADCRPRYLNSPNEEPNGTCYQITILDRKKFAGITILSGGFNFCTAMPALAQNTRWSTY